MGYSRHAAGKRSRNQDPLYDLNIATPSHAERARTLVAGLATGTLCTAACESSGHPYGSFISFALDGSAPVFLISQLAEHTKNLQGDQRCSLLVAETGEGDPLARGRVTLMGTAQPLDRGEASESARTSYLAAHPSANYYVDFKDFSFWKMEVTGIRYIGGYGRMSWVESPDWQNAAADPIAASSQAIINHMNEDHSDTMALYCRAFSKATFAEEVCMTAVDRYGFEMSVKTDKGPRPVRVAFTTQAQNAGDIRKLMVELAQQARSALNDN